MTLRVITVSSEDLPKADRLLGYSYAVVLGDLVLAGHILGHYVTQVEADKSCREFGAHYGLRAYLIQSTAIRLVAVNGERVGD